MFTRTTLLTMGIILAVGIAAAQDCPYKDEWGEPTMHTGGAALAGAVDIVDPHGEFGIPNDYEAWDLNGDGIPDKLQFGLLTEILCLPSNTPHPTLNIAEIQASFANSLAAYWNMVNTMKASEQAMIDGRQDIMAMSVDLRAVADAAGRLDEVMPPEAFGATEVPDQWVGATWEDLADSMYTVAGGISYLVSQGYIGDPNAIIWLLLDNLATSHIVTAIWGFDSAYTQTFFDLEYMSLLQQFATFQQLDWVFIMGQFPALDTDLVANFETAATEINLDETFLPAPEDITITSNGEDALVADAQWGDGTLLDLFNNYGDNIGVIWDVVLEQIPAMPVATPLSLLAMAGLCVAVAAGALRRKK